MHTPVLLEKAIDALNVAQGKKYIDATYGEGGHAREIVRRGGEVLGLDWDPAVAKAFGDSDRKGKLTVITANYADIKRIAQKYNFAPCSGVIFDLGLSMGQIRDSSRGFSYEALDGPLDMRISLSLQATAADIVNSYSESRLYELFSKISQEVNSRAIAEAFVRARSIEQIRTVRDVISALKKNKIGSKKTLARIFQALRIEVNHELENIQSGIAGAAKIIKKTGKIVVITFHEVEDRLVKNKAREHGLRIYKVESKELKRFERSAHIRVLTVT
ncbi:MAG: 16S rRNA (cytosine(1402)-N(4))-methyltransferase RsmH [Candidatus Paceibacterota bacterium]